jgi:hypothetical protein
LSCFGVELPALAGRGQSLVKIHFSLVQPIHERRRLVVASAPEIVEQRPDQFAPALNFRLVRWNGDDTDLRISCSNRNEGSCRCRCGNGTLGRGGNGSTLRRRALGAGLSRDIRRRTRRLQRMLGRPLEDRTDPCEPPQDIFHVPLMVRMTPQTFERRYSANRDLFAIEIQTLPADRQKCCCCSILPQATPSAHLGFRYIQSSFKGFRN